MSYSSKPQLLVVDDDPSIRESLGALLTSAGYDVVVAESGVSAVSHLDRTVADLVVTDLNMPGMSGMDLISHVRSRYPATLIVAMSGDYQGDSVPAGIIADRYYPKGQHPHNLLAVIASLIEIQAAEGVYEISTRPALDS
jgi:DNA-binding response OmpR family regulator